MKGLAWCVGGGAGNDTIVFSALTTNMAFSIVGGADNDSIFIQTVADDVENASARFQLGTGADTLTISGAAITSGSSLGTFVLQLPERIELVCYGQVRHG